VYIHILLTQRILYLSNTHGTTFLSVSIKFITRRLDKANCLFYLIKKRIKTNQFLIRLGLITNALAWGVLKTILDQDRIYIKQTHCSLVSDYIWVSRLTCEQQNHQQNPSPHQQVRHCVAVFRGPSSGCSYILRIHHR